MLFGVKNTVYIIKFAGKHESLVETSLEICEMYVNSGVVKYFFCANALKKQKYWEG